MLAAGENSREADNEDWLGAPRTGDTYLDHLLNTADQHLEQLVNEPPGSDPWTAFGQDNPLKLAWARTRMAKPTKAGMQF